MSLDLDALIDAAADEMSAKHPHTRRSAGSKFEDSVKRISRDRAVQDSRDRKARGPMPYQPDAPRIVLPPGAKR